MEVGWVPVLLQHQLHLLMSRGNLLTNQQTNQPNNQPTEGLRGGVRVNQRPQTGKGKAVPLQDWSGPEGPRKLRFPDFMTTAQDGGKVVSLPHRPPLPPGMFLVLIFTRG